MIWVLLILSLVFGGFSLLQFNHTESLFLWKLSIMSTEFGHWFALATCVLTILAAFSKKKLARWALFISTLATVSFLRPTIELAWNFHSWSSDLVRAFDIQDEEPKTFPNLAGLYMGAYRQAPANVQTIKFWQSGKDSLSFDYYPSMKSQADAPWVLVVHGGGWDSGDRLQLADLNSYLASKGFAVISMDYRLAPEAVWPAQKDDVWNVVDYVKAHAQEMKINASRWAILGRSAGGQIAERIAFGPPEHGDFKTAGLHRDVRASEFDFRIRSRSRRRYLEIATTHPRLFRWNTSTTSRYLP